MPYTLNGFGTRFYGQRDIGPDGSYITTAWVTALYVPLVPYASYRVLPVGEGTNIVIHRSQNYRVLRVPLCWPQVRNVYLCASPILILVSYFGGAEAIRSWKEEAAKSNSSHSALKLETAQTQPEGDLSSEAADASCGNVLKLDKDAFVKLDLIHRFDQIEHESGFTDQEIQEMDEKELGEQAFGAYSLAYLTWNKPFSRTDLDKLVVKAVDSVVNSPEWKRMSASERAQLDELLVKLKRMMLRAFDMGRHDARSSPCPYLKS